MQTIAVWVSWGCASAAAAKLTIEKYGSTHDIKLVNNPVIEEGPDNERFGRDLSKWLNWPIEYATNPNFPDNSAVSVWDKRGFMSGPLGAPCTIKLKKQARQLWESKNHVDWHVLGFTADEYKRHERFIKTERDNVIPVLIRAGMTKQDCMDMVVAAGIELPQAYRDGFVNANCMGCVKATSATYWNRTREAYPDVFSARSEQSRRLGAKLVRHKGKRLFLDELPPDAKGRPMKELKMPDCGSFCEEKA